MEMSAASTELRDVLVSVYVPHVRRRLVAMSIEPDEALANALSIGRTWLADELTALFTTPHPQQSRGPLELFQEAMRFPTEELRRRGVDPVHRNAVAERAIPGDVYDLAPASSSLLGETVWQAHLAWGAEKASVMAEEL